MENYEKKYKEALKRAKTVITLTSSDEAVGAATTIFPELKESEDERIRKMLIRIYKKADIMGGEIFGEGITYKQVIAWLEKQGEQKLINKVKSKIKVGDWIVNKGNSYLIADIDYLDNRYLFEIGGYTHEQQNWEYIKNADEHYHLWTVQDAKDGDVLDFDCGVGIFKNLSVDGYNAHCYCYYDTNSQLEINDCSLYDTYNAEPATKEQRDTLFAKIKKVGYEWNAEKKELKKIEQNPSWSEEDEEMIRRIRCYLNEFGNWLSDKNEEKSQSIYKACDWLKSIKPNH